MQHCSYLQVLISTWGVLAIANRSVSMQEQYVTVDDYSNGHCHHHHHLQEDNSFLQVFLEQGPGRPLDAAWQSVDAAACAEVPHPSMQGDRWWHTLQDSQGMNVLDQVPQPSTQGHDLWYGSRSQQSNRPSEPMEVHPGLQFVEQWDNFCEVEMSAQANLPDQMPQPLVNTCEEYTPTMSLTHDSSKLHDLSWPEESSPSAQKQVSPRLSMIQEVTQGTAGIGEASTRSELGATAEAAADTHMHDATGIADGDEEFSLSMGSQAGSGQALLLCFIGTSMACILLAFCLQHDTGAGQALALNAEAANEVGEDVENRKYEGLSAFLDRPPQWLPDDAITQMETSEGSERAEQ